MPARQLNIIRRKWLQDSNASSIVWYCRKFVQSNEWLLKWKFHKLLRKSLQGDSGLLQESYSKVARHFLRGTSTRKKSKYCINITVFWVWGSWMFWLEIIQNSSSTFIYFHLVFGRKFSTLGCQGVDVLRGHDGFQYEASFHWQKKQNRTCCGLHRGIDFCLHHSHRVPGILQETPARY